MSPGARARIKGRRNGQAGNTEATKDAPGGMRRAGMTEFYPPASTVTTFSSPSTTWARRSKEILSGVSCAVWYQG
ncbi:hypothetical protein BH24ACI4_BH24ACI4_28190 [soil metagenome]